MYQKHRACERIGVSVESPELNGAIMDEKDTDEKLSDFSVSVFTTEKTPTPDLLFSDYEDQLLSEIQVSEELLQQTNNLKSDKPIGIDCIYPKDKKALNDEMAKLLLKNSHCSRRLEDKKGF